MNNSFKFTVRGICVYRRYRRNGYRVIFTLFSLVYSYLVIEKIERIERKREKKGEYIVRFTIFSTVREVFMDMEETEE